MHQLSGSSVLSLIEESIAMRQIDDRQTIGGMLQVGRNEGILCGFGCCLTLLPFRLPP